MTIAGEHHKSHRSPWLRAAVLGANDGIVSTASLLVGVAAAGSSHAALATAGCAAVAAGAMSMAAGEFVSVSSQRDVEEADLEIERQALAEHPEAELHELARIYEARGLSPATATKVAEELHQHDAFASHARDELGLTAIAVARPFEAAWTSAVAFTAGAGRARRGARAPVEFARHGRDLCDRQGRRYPGLSRKPQSSRCGQSMRRVWVRWCAALAT